MGAELALRLAKRLRLMGKSLWLVADGAYAKRPFLAPLIDAGVVVVSRLRRDAALYGAPTPPKPGQRRRGRPRKYGKDRIDLAKRAGQTRGWSTAAFPLYGKMVIKRFKTFLATYPPAGGLIRVVLVKNDDGTWVAYFCTNPNASVAEILEAVADRSAIEQLFHDVKEVHGAGQPQVRNVWANVGAWHVALWLHALVELWAWRRPRETVCDRSSSPWDHPDRRPSHADRCKALRRECMEQRFSRHAADEGWTRKTLSFVRRLASLAA